MSTDPLTVEAAALAQAGLRISGLSKSFQRTQVLKHVGLDVQPGEIVAVAGPSGAGKTTLGRLVSGLETADAGSVQLAGRELLAQPPQRRHVAHMFESFALYPNMTAFDNIASPLRSPACREKPDAPRIRQRVMDLMELTEIAHLAERRPSDMSGGQKQRVALCRTLVQQPDLFILDEPIGHLDAKLRHKLRGEIRRRQKALAQPTLWFTPDVVEAMAVADRVVMLVDGGIRQVGNAAALTQSPADTDVARLTGDPSMNLLSIQLHQQQGQWWARFDGSDTLLPQWVGERMAAEGVLAATLGFLPAHTEVQADVLLGPDGLPATVYAVEPFGKYTLLTLTVAGQRIRAKVPAASEWSIDQRVSVGMPAQGLCLFHPNSGRLLAVSSPAP
ncbi:ABC transporter ATP-binding protein [Corticibacter populi]|uniref:ABC transporter ATP-binding protein n=1 Tax=Corticibacter populi TaxID=1550736 RepID=A0A3M6QQT5_9BURK|nr:ABC transporter ATP-binding protein [Corticibacter populi]RMX04812.1 ABC transporter ATP-binding protein [Corticibacter populi]RZS33771.1 multiple sugar transport system ATP-binding protein [Corticibacter populi]